MIKDSIFLELSKSASECANVKSELHKTPKHTPHPFFDAQKRRSASALVLLAHTFRPYQPTIAVSSPLLITFITRFLSLGINGGDW
ncbi:hypothetical protein L1887_19195 [Cichorium endivia]|nr:hypothetical protein L1887_19195 [Cichorium endivia]